MGRSWPLLGRSWTALGSSWAAPGRSWAALGSLLVRLGPILEPLGAILGRLGAILGRSWGILGRSWAPKRAQTGGRAAVVVRRVAPPRDFLQKVSAFKGLEKQEMFTRDSQHAVLRWGRRIEERFARPPPPPSVFDRFESAFGFCEDQCG